MNERTGLADWQVDGEGAALAELALNRDIAGMGLCNVFNNGKSKAGAAHGAAAGLVYPVKPFKKPRQMLFGDANSLISDLDLYFGVMLMG